MTVEPGRIGAVAGAIARTRANLGPLSAECAPDGMAESNDWLPVGKVVAVQGLKGELRINPASEFPERFTEPGTRWLKARGKAPQEIELKSGRKLPGKSIFVVRFAGIESRAEAESLVGQTLMVPADDRPELAEGEFHLLD